jgi:hypothetical protein
MANGPERYHLYVECRKCRHEIPFKEVLESKPDDPPLTSQSVQLTCPSCKFEAVYRPTEIRLGILDPDE